ncbi:hypothetical protein ACHAWO_011023 [Cyclotella atomus]|uniref:Uncharacterized protein n=1 Tax=Cyclotella atomus TaxID=382360 RepID=A0ABD3P5M4_9STRA
MAPSIISAAACALAIFAPSSEAFVPVSTHAARHDVSSLSATTDRRGFMSNVASASAAVAGVSSAWMTPGPALAYGLKKANEKLASAQTQRDINITVHAKCNTVSYGLPSLSNIPDGFSALTEIYGKSGDRSPLLVAFGFPLDWVVTLPSQDVNGEAGTIQAGEYAKGDTATFFLLPGEGKVSNIHDKDKNFFKSALIAAISQKGSNIYQDFKIIKTNPVTNDGQNYMLVDFKYTLLTGAGFEVERQGVASVTSVGDGVQLLWAASISARYKNKTEKTLRSIVESFRCYADGLNFSADLKKGDFN